MRSSEPASTVAADRDLACAAVLLEGSPGELPDLARAHLSCAIAFGQRDLWELEDQHYAAAAVALGPDNRHPRLLHAILYNHAEMQVNWTCALRELGDRDAVMQHGRIAAEVMERRGGQPAAVSPDR